MSNAARDKRWSAAVMKKYGGRCPCCNKKANGGAHHIIDRSNLKTRWLIANGIATCAVLHRMFEGAKSLRENAIENYVGLKKYYILEAIAEGLVLNNKYEEIK